MDHTEKKHTTASSTVIESQGNICKWKKKIYPITSSYNHKIQGRQLTVHKSLEIFGVLQRGQQKLNSEKQASCQLGFSVQATE